jgi:hypothetical protein
MPDYPDLAETVIFMSGRSSFRSKAFGKGLGRRESFRNRDGGVALEVYVQYSSYLLLNLETINKSYEPFHLPRNSSLIFDIVRHHASHHVYSLARSKTFMLHPPFFPRRILQRRGEADDNDEVSGIEAVHGEDPKKRSQFPLTWLFQLALCQTTF